MVKRLTEEEFLQRVNTLWQQFHDRPEMVGITFEEFKSECYKEYRKQQQMSDATLDEYRHNCYNTLIKETEKLTTPEEREKLNNQDNQTITIQDEMKFNNGVKVVDGNDKKM